MIKASASKNYDAIFCQFPVNIAVRCAVQVNNSAGFGEIATVNIKTTEEVVHGKVLSEPVTKSVVTNGSVRNASE